MALSVFDLFKIGIGPSSSHTVGPMRAAGLFVQALASGNLLDRVAKVRTELYGSLGATGKGHGSDTAIMLGLCGWEPASIDPDAVPQILADIATRGEIQLMGNAAGNAAIAFDARADLLFHRRSLPLHANGMRLLAFDKNGALLRESVYYSVGGGFVVSEEVLRDQTRQAAVIPDASALPLPFESGAQLLALTQQHGISIAALMHRNERHWRSDAEIRTQLLAIWRVMQACIARGCRTEGVLPGGFRVRRRAAALARKLAQQADNNDPFIAMDWVNLWALAVNEENAAGGRVVTAPTNGAAGIVPAVLHYYVRYVSTACDDGVIDFLLTAAAIGMLYKKNASISGAEVGCQGEVGVACSMAAAGLCAVLGGTPAQVENAAEIGMEHHLGLTCDPVGGLVQIPCIERNAVAAIQAINAARMALHGDGAHHVRSSKPCAKPAQT